MSFNTSPFLYLHSDHLGISEASELIFYFSKRVIYTFTEHLIKQLYIESKENFLTRALRCELDLFEAGHNICEAEKTLESNCLEGYMKARPIWPCLRNTCALVFKAMILINGFIIFIWLKTLYLPVVPNK